MGWNDGAVAFNVVPFVLSTWRLAVVATGAILEILYDFLPGYVVFSDVEGKENMTVYYRNAESTTEYARKECPVVLIL